jgi:predicted Rossmann fold nucleotide-binding protein DprA/Smf involved in DNA uptake
MSINIAFVGSRQFTDATLVRRSVEALRAKHGDFRLVSGGAKGADSLSEHAARALMPEQKPIIFLPNSEKAKQAFGSSFRDRAFGRNEWIVDNAEFVVAFFAGAKPSGGTLNTVNHARRQGKMVYMYFAARGEWETIPATMTTGL